MARSARVLTAVVAGSLAAAPLVALLPHAQAKGFDLRHMPKIQHRLLSGPLAAVVDAAAGDDRNSGDGFSPRPPAYYPTDTTGCTRNFGTNIKVNQNCQNLTDPDLQGRAQAQNETSIAQDGLHPQNLVASYNDYRRGDGNCYTAYSKDGGHNWADVTVPMSFTRGTAFNATARQYWQGGGDTSVAWDTKGNAYLSCQVFNRGAAVSSNPDLSSAFYVFRSTHNAGASWNFPGRPVAESNDTAGAGLAFEDKQLLTVDNHKGSPYQDRVYVSYTEFTPDGTAYIYDSYSKDYGETFSKRVLVSRNSSMCGNTYGLPTPKGKCNENQFSQPFTGADGSLYITWDNYNNAVSGNENRNQILMAKSTDGGQSFGAPVRVGYYYDLPDCATYQGGQDLGRACVPEKAATTNSIFRATNYSSGAVNPTNAKQVVITFGSYLNRHSNESNGCKPVGFSSTTGQDLYTGVKRAGACNNDILVSVSNDGGRTFTGTTTDPRRLQSATMGAGQATTDQFWQWATFSNDGRFATSYFDRQYGNDERTGFSDVTLSVTRGLAAYGSSRVTTSSMPPPSQFGGLFYGDYTGLTGTNGTFYPLWSDTRNDELFLCPGTGQPGSPPLVCRGAGIVAKFANDQNAFTRAMSSPVG